jgi:molecular chaperone GrpE
MDDLNEQPQDAPQGGDPSANAGPATEPGQAEGQTEAGELQRQLEEQRDRYLRLAAEYDNYRKRTAKERVETSARAQGELVRQLIDPLDDLARVTAQDPQVVDARTIHEGVEVVDKKLMKALSAAGLEVLDPVDQPFNPELHEAVATEPALSREDDHLVARVYQLGYVFKGMLLRPARVVVKQWNG